MKDQKLNAANGSAEFIDIKNAKNPFYQPMAGKAILKPEGKIAVKDAIKTEENETIADANTSIIDPTIASRTTAQTKQTEDITRKPALNLEGTLKLVEELHRRMVQRGRLVHTIANLDKFEIEQKEEAEDITSNYYQGCEIEITDDKRNKFSTKNPVIIKAVALFVRDLCTNRLAEIEAEIIIPE